MRSMSGRSSRSTLMLMNSSFITRAVSGSSNDSCAMTWHQWHAEYPTDSRIGLCSARALSRAAAPQGYQSTGLCACWRRYGLVSCDRWLAGAAAVTGSIKVLGPVSSRMRATWPLYPHGFSATRARGECRDANPMSSDVSILKLKRGEDRRIRSGHLWVFSNEIDNAATPLAGFTAGARARVHSDRDQFLGHAYVNPHALICARIVGRDVAQP